MPNTNPIWTCDHVRDGDAICRVTNLEGRIFADCGRRSHFEDLRRHGTTRPMRMDHLPSEIAEIAGALPICCSAYLQEGDWYFESFEDSEPVPENSLYCLTVDKVLTTAPDIIRQNTRYLYFSSSGAVTILNNNGIRNVPIWSEGHVETGRRQKSEFGPDEMRAVEHEEFLFLSGEFQHFGIRFLNLNYGATTVRNLVLVDEFLDVVED